MKNTISWWKKLGLATVSPMVMVLFLSCPAVAENIALNKPTHVSSVYKDCTGDKAVDGDISNFWNASSFPSQSIEIDFQGSYKVDAICFLPQQTPLKGHTQHKVYFYINSNWVLVHTFEGETTSGRVIEHNFDRPYENVSKMKVVTTKSNSWVAWRELQVIGKKME